MKTNNMRQAHPIQTLQHMLRCIMKYRQEPCRLIPDGIYGSETAAAVMAFQTQHGIRATGSADQQTWEAILKEYDDVSVESEPLCMIRAKMTPVTEGEENACIQMAQCMLRTISTHYHLTPLPEVTGCYDSISCECLRNFQNLCGLEPTGDLDKKTWKHLALQFSAMHSNL